MKKRKSNGYIAVISLLLALALGVVYNFEGIENKLSDSSTKNRITFKEGDRFSVTVKNTNTTIAQIIRNFLYRIAGNDTYQIAAQHGGIVTVNGTK